MYVHIKELPFVVTKYKKPLFQVSQVATSEEDSTEKVATLKENPVKKVATFFKSSPPSHENKVATFQGFPVTFGLGKSVLEKVEVKKRCEFPRCLLMETSPFKVEFVDANGDLKERLVQLCDVHGKKSGGEKVVVDEI